MIERDAISLFPFRWKLSLFFSLLQFFLQVSCLCLLQSEGWGELPGWRANCGCDYRFWNRKCLNANWSERKKKTTLIITGCGVKIDCVQLIKIILETLHIQSRTSTTSFYFWNLGIGKFHHHHLFYCHHLEAITGVFVIFSFCLRDR